MKTFNATVVRQVVTQEDRCHNFCFFLSSQMTNSNYHYCDLYSESLEQLSALGKPFRCEQCLKDHKDTGKWADRFNPNNYKDGKYTPPSYS